MNQIDEMWVLFCILFIFLVLSFFVTRNVNRENYSGTVSDVPKFIKKTPAKTIEQDYESVDDEEEEEQEYEPPAPQRTQGNAKPLSETFDKDVTNPSVYMFRSQVHVPSKNAQQIGADPFRGDIHIAPVNRNGHFQSRYGSESLRHDTMFNSIFAEKYDALTNPMRVSNEEIIMDH